MTASEFLVRFIGMEQHAFGYWLRLKRKALDLSREEFAARIGYSATMLRKLESDLHR